MGRWAQAHSRDDMTKDENLDPDLLMWNIRRRVTGEGIPRDRPFVVLFHFLGVPKNRSWFWLLFRDGAVEICVRNPNYEIGLTVTADIRSMTQVWLGHLSLDQAIRKRAVLLEGDRTNVHAFSRWFNLSFLAIKNSDDMRVAHRVCRDCGETDVTRERCRQLGQAALDGRASA
jgi:hypothetical protein